MFHVREHHPALGKLRSMILATLVFGLSGTAVELLLLGHDESLGQLVPVVLIALALFAVVWQVLSRTPSSLMALRILMAAFIVAGVLGVALHCKGRIEFQKEIDPSINAFDLFRKVMQSQSPPALAPGLMAQLGLLGLAYAYRHPSERKNQ